MSLFDDIAANASSVTDAELGEKITSLCRLRSEEITKTILDTGISKQDLVSVLQVVNDESKNNLQKAESIKGISKGVDTLVSLLGKLI